MLEALFLLLAGLALLIAGGELLVRGAVALAKLARVSPLLIGIAIVGLGTSMPELVTSVEAAIIGAPGIAWGNIVGSNLANTLAILGAAALVAPFVVGERGLWRDTMTGLGATLLLFGLGWYGLLGTVAGIGLATLLGLYILLAYIQERRSAEHHGAAFDKGAAHDEIANVFGLSIAGWGGAALLTLAGLGLLVFGGRTLVLSAVDLARMWGMSETVIGLSIVAFGTSAPELITSVVAAVRRHGELAFGNVVGSNIYNLLGIGGFTAIVAPGSLPQELLRTEFPILIGSAILLVVLALIGRRFGRLLGAALFGGYVAYMVLLIMGTA